MISYLHVEKAFLRFHIVNHHHASIQIVHFGKQLKFQRPTKSTEKLISMKCKISRQIIHIHAWVAASRDSVRKWSKKMCPVLIWMKNMSAMKTIGQHFEFPVICSFRFYWCVMVFLAFDLFGGKKCGRWTDTFHFSKSGVSFVNSIFTGYYSVMTENLARKWN